VYGTLGEAALGVEKKRIKQQLKAFDAAFLHTHKRMPTKVEKEPIRGLYEEYHLVKSHLRAKEQQNQQQHQQERGEKKQHQQGQQQPPQQPHPHQPASQQPHAPRELFEKGPAARQQPVKQAQSSSAKGPPPMPQTHSSPSSASTAAAAATTAAAAATATVPPTTSSFADLAAEKRRLHEMLKRYRRPSGVELNQEHVLTSTPSLVSTLHMNIFLICTLDGLHFFQFHLYLFLFFQTTTTTTTTTTHA
jgi:hypothetical protein